MEAEAPVATSSPAESRGGETVPVLRTEALTIRFGGLTALNKVNLDIRRGEAREGGRGGVENHMEPDSARPLSPHLDSALAP